MSRSLAVIVTVLVGVVSAQDSAWTTRILPDESHWTYSDAQGINEAGVIVGRYAGTSYRDEHGIVWTDTGYIELESYIGLPAGFTNSVAWDVNESGIIAGETKVPDRSLPIRAILWDYNARTVQIIHPSGTGHDDISRTTRIYDDGSALLSLYRTQGGTSQRGYFRGPGGVGNRLYEPPAPWESCSIHEINPDGVAIGFSYSLTPSYTGHAMAWFPNGTVVDIHNEIAAALPAGEGASLELSIAYRVEPDGQISGFARDGTLDSPYAWVRDPDGAISFLPTGGFSGGFSGPAGSGRILAGTVGALFGPNPSRACVWIDGVLGLLPNPVGYHQMSCSAVDSKGTVVGQGVFEDKEYWYQGGRAFICEPTESGDFDNDGLLDKWELEGYVHDNDAAVDLPGMGANPLRRDLFVEIDSMVGNGYDHRPTAATLKPVVDAFAAHDIALHIHIDESIPFDAELGTLDGLDRYQWAEFDAVKAAHFAPELESAVRYCVFAHRLATLTDSGAARGEPSSDFIVSLGAFVEESGSNDPWMQAGTFMHELGHTLGLRHGGADVNNQKPNYLSVMNYDFQKQGLRIGGQDGNFDYSCCKLPDLNENALDEGVGLGTSPLISGAQTMYRALRFNAGTLKFEFVPTWSGDVTQSIDWNDSKAIDAATVPADINGDGSIGVLIGHDDWSALDFKGGTVGFGVGLPAPPPPPETVVAEELTVEIAKEIPPPSVEGIAGRAGRGSVRVSWTAVGPYGQGQYKVYRWSSMQTRADAVLVKETEASLLSDRVGRGTWNYVVTVTDSLGTESLDSDTLRVRIR